MNIQALCLLPDGITDDIEGGPIRYWIANDWPIFDTLIQRLDWNQCPSINR